MVWNIVKRVTMSSVVICGFSNVNFACTNKVETPNYHCKHCGRYFCNLCKSALWSSDCCNKCHPAQNSANSQKIVIKANPAHGKTILPSFQNAKR